MLHKLNLIPLLLIPVLSATYVLREKIVELPWNRDARTAANLPAMDRFQIASKQTGAEYQVFVQRPHGYDESDKRYPVFYSVPARPRGGEYAEVVLPLLRNGVVPEMIVVSIATSERTRGGAMAVLQGRERGDLHAWEDDLTFDASPKNRKKGGDAERFVAFLEQELMPRIDNEYRTDPTDRGIGGAELGGLFAVEVCFRRPGLFQRAIAIEPRAYWADYAVVDYLKTLDSDPPAAPTRLYVGVGDEDYEGYVTAFEILRDGLEQSPPGFVELKTELLHSRTHDSQMLPAAQSGLRFVFQN